MSVMFISRDSVYYVAEQESGPAVTGKSAFTSDCISVCAASDKLLYYIPSDAPLTIRSWNLKSKDEAEKSALVGEVSGPQALSKIVFHNNKAYAVASPSDSLYVYDPLNKSVETIHVGVPVADFEAASHGFVLQDTTGHLYGFHFNQGLTPVAGVDSAQLLGHYKRLAVALRLPEKQPIAVTEVGGLMESGFPTVRRRFVAIKDKVVEVDGTGLFYNHRRVPLPSDVVTIKDLIRVPQMDDETVCTLCFCEFDDEVGITFDCGHQFHLDCINQWARRWDEFKTKGTHVVFTNAVCPGGCKHLMRHPAVPQAADIAALYKETTTKTKAVVQSLGGTKVDDDILFYMCNRCGHPFCGGERVCFRMQGQEPSKAPEDLLCDDCRNDFRCDTHNRQFVVYKCHYCCNPATQLSFGTRYLCDRCNARWEASTEPEAIPCPGVAQCPLSAHHSDNAACPVVIGCRACLPPDALVYERVVQPRPAASMTNANESPAS